MTDIFDHFPNFVIVKFDSKKEVKVRPQTRVFNKRNNIKFHDSLLRLNWDALLDPSVDIDVAFDLFTSELQICYNSSFSLVKLSKKPLAIKAG